MECISRIERAIEDERGWADVLSGEPSVAQIELTLNDGAAAAANLLRWLAQVDAKTKQVVALSIFKRTDKHLSHYRPIIRELGFMIETAKQNLPKKKRGRRPAKFLPRLAGVIADEIARAGHHIDAKQNGPLCQTFAIALDALEIERSKHSGIVSKMLRERGN